MWRFRKMLLPATMAGFLLSTSALAQEPVKVVVTIKPIHSLVAGVMQGVGEPELLIPGAGSPHSYALKPSQARSLERAGVVVRVSEELETFLNRSIANLAAKADVVTLDGTKGLTRYKVREGGLWDSHDHDHGHSEKHDDHDHKEKHDDHGHEKKAAKAKKDTHDHDKHDHKKHAEKDHDHDKHDHKEHAEKDHDHDEHAHGELDAHIWLDPVNASKMTDAIAAALSRKWPAHKAAFDANASKLRAKLDKLDHDLEHSVEGLKGRPYIVFHDAYRHFEERYGLTPAGSVTVSPDRKPGAKRLKELRGRIKQADAVCVFAEPQFEPKLVSTITEGTKAKRGVLDPLGADTPAGPDQYFVLMRNLASALAGCLKPAG